MTHSTVFMSKYRSMKPIKVHLADDGTVEALRYGDVEMVLLTPHATSPENCAVCTYRECEKCG